MKHSSLFRTKALIGAASAAAAIAATTLVAAPAGAILPIFPPGPPGIVGLSNVTSIATTSTWNTSIVDDAKGHLFVTTGNGEVDRMNLDGTHHTTITTGLGHWTLGLAMAPDGKLWAGSTDHHLYSVDPTTGAKTQLFDTGETPSCVTFDDLGHVYVGAESGASIYRFNLDGTHKVTLATGIDAWGLVSDHAGHIYWANGYNGGGWRMNADGTNQVQVVSGIGVLEGVGLLPDHHILWGSYSQSLVYESGPDGTNVHSFAAVPDAQNCVFDSPSGNIYCAQFNSSVDRVSLSPKATAGTGTASVSWTASSPGSAATDTYTAVAVPGNGGAPLELTVPASQLSTTFYGLTNGVPYQFYVYATNFWGDSNNSALSLEVTPNAFAPDAPASVAVARLGGAVKATWPAAVTHGTGVTAYLATAYPTNSLKPAARILVPAGATSAVLSGLANGSPYRVDVTALSAVGNSPLSPMSAAVIPAGAPSWTSAPTAVAGSKSAKVTWAAANANGSPITSYKVISFPGSKTCSTTGALSCTVVGLSPGVTYKFKVVATNKLGTSPASAASNAIVAKA